MKLKNGAIVGVRISRTSDTVRHLKKFRIISNENALLLLILC